MAAMQQAVVRGNRRDFVCERMLHKIALCIPKLGSRHIERQRKSSSNCRSTLPLYYDHLSGHLLVASHGGLVA